MSSKNIPVSIAGAKQEGLSKMSRNRARFDTSAQRLPKPAWIRVRLPTGNAVAKLKSKLRANHLSSVCEEASCPNIHECFSKGTATFMILGEICTRRCSFCDVAHGRPLAVDDAEPENLARTVADMGLRYVVVTSVDRDDLRDGGAAHFARCIVALRAACPQIRIEILTPDFRGKGRLDSAMAHLSAHPPDVFNHNVETVSSLYPNVRPGADYQWSLSLLKAYKAENPGVISKSGIMLGLGEDMNQIQSCLHDLRAHDVEMLTVGQYLQPTRHHHPVLRYWTPQAFEEIAVFARSLGFSHVASGPMVRSSYHADLSASQTGLLL